MAFPKLLQKLFQNNGAGDKLRSEILPDMNYLPLSGGTMTGTLVVAQGSNSIDGGVADGSVQFNANGNLGGANLRLYGAQNTQFPGQFRIWAQIGDKSRGLFGDVNGDANGSLTWGGKPVLCGESGGFPVGFIALYSGNNVPDGWFRCDGSTVSNMQTNYPKLYAVLGTNVLPNYSGAYPLGATSDINSTVPAGLPNATGTWTQHEGSATKWGIIQWAGGAFFGDGPRSKYFIPTDFGDYSAFYSCHLDLSKSNAIYGSSTTVTPPSVKCTYLIRHD